MVCKLWNQNIDDLFSSYKIIPNCTMSTNEKINCLIRLLFILFIFSLVFLKINYEVYIIQLIIIIFLFYIKERSMDHKENFSHKTPLQAYGWYDNKTPLQNIPCDSSYIDNQGNIVENVSRNYNPKTNISNYSSYIDDQGNIIENAGYLNYSIGYKNGYKMNSLGCDQQTNYDIPPDVIYKRAVTDGQGNIIQNVGRNPFANDKVKLEPNDPNYVSNNYKIVGNPNPKTLIAPVIVPPIADLSYWKANNLITHTHINDNKNLDVYQSGYEVSNFCGDNTCPKINNNYNFAKLNSNYKKIKQGDEHKLDTHRNNRFHQKYNDHQKKTHRKAEEEVKENFKLADYDNQRDKIENIGLVNRSCGYDQNQFKKTGLPVNLSVGRCEKEPGLKDFNTNLHTEIIQPGVYTINQVNEPINSNIGISFEQQFEPLTYDVDEFGITFTENDPLNPNFNEKDNILKYNENEVIEPVTPYNIYDPRFTGYGTSYRAYTDENIGQTRFFYDDVDSIRMPNYVVRSKIDFADFADTYGPMKDERGNENNSTIRALANQKFVDDALTFRIGMQERLMRKVNSEKWQQRSKPISTGGQRMLGGSKW